jgi:hypothetical protein
VIQWELIRDYVKMYWSLINSPVSEGRGSICESRAFAVRSPASRHWAITENGIMHTPMRCTVAFLLILLPWTACARADDELLVKTYPVTITTNLAELAADQPIRVLKVSTGPLPLEPVAVDAKFDEAGVCHVDLPAATYRFEILSSAQIHMLVAVHSPPVEVKSATDVKLKGVDLGEVAVRSGKDSLELQELGIRSIGPEGEHAEPNGVSSKIHFIANADETYACRFIATSSDEAQTYVGWEKLTATKNPKIIVTKPQYNVCTFIANKELPITGQLTATLIFPTTQLDWPADATKTLLTNRDFITLSYRIDTDDHSTLQFLPVGYALHKATTLRLGGKLKASGYAEPVFTREDDGEGNRLFWVVSLVDPNGQVVDDSHSGFNIKPQASLDNAEWTSESPYHGIDTKKLNNLTTRLRLRVTSDLPDLSDVPVTPQPFVTVADNKYSLRIPGSWTFRGRVYLSKLERLNAASRMASGRPGPAQVTINWRMKVNDAWAIVGDPKGDGRGLWMSMQVNGLAVDDLFEEPWAMTHEMMHTFGYNHGPEMNKQISRALFLFNLGRWEAWDNRGFVP